MSACVSMFVVSRFIKFTLVASKATMNDHLFGKGLFVRFAAGAFRKLLSIYLFSYFPFGFEGQMWDLIVSVPDHCLSFYLPCTLLTLTSPFVLTARELSRYTCTLSMPIKS